LGVSAADQVNLIQNGNPITSTTGWTPLSTNNLSFGYSGTNSIYMTCTKASSVYGMSIKSPTFQAKSDVDYNFKVKVVFSNWSGASLVLEIINGDRSKIAYVKTENVTNNTYEFSGNFVGSSDTFVINMSASQYSALPVGASFQIHSAEVYERNPITEAIDKQTEEQKGMFARLLDGIMSFFTGLFLPKDGFFDQYLADWNDWMGDRFGALYFPFDLMFSFLGKVLAFQPPATPLITFPEINVPVGEGYKIMEKHDYSFDFLSQQPYSWLYGLYQSMIWCIFGFGLVKLCQSKLDKIMSGG